MYVYLVTIIYYYIHTAAILNAIQCNMIIDDITMSRERVKAACQYVNAGNFQVAKYFANQAIR